MARTGENIYKRKDGRWEARYIKSYEFGGKARYAYIYAKTYADVKAKLIKALNINLSHTEQKVISNLSSRYSEILDDWLMYCKPRVKESTYIRYKNSVNNHIRPHLGKYPIQKISTSIMEHYVSELFLNGRKDGKGGLSQKSVSDIVTIIKETFKYASLYGITINCCLDHLLKKRERHEMRVLSTQEQRNLVRLLLQDTDRYKLGVFLSLYTGIRIGELCALKWMDISILEKTLKINRTMQRIQTLDPDDVRKTHIIITEPKSQAANRMIPLPEFIIEILLPFKSLPNNYVLTGSRSGYVEPRTMQNHFKNYISESGIEDANFHSLRHTFATRGVESGFDIKSLSEILGHSSVEITLDKYVHSSMEQKRLNMKRIEFCGA